MVTAVSRLAIVLSLLLPTLVGPSLVRAADAPPSAPAGLVANAYGMTAGGIRWARSSDDRGVVGYEIVRDGDVLGVRDTLSHVERDLEPGRSYRYAVTAIDTAGQRSAISRIVLTTVDALPAAPEGLRVAIYSSTAAGLAWDRPVQVGLRHEIRRDGRAVETTGRLSYIDRSLAADREYRFEVIAINRQGLRSDAARSIFRTPRRTSTAAPPAAPTGLRAAVYSSTAAGIAWARPATPWLRYEVSRDDEVLATSDALSYVDRALLAGRTYVYAVVAIDASGRRSAAARIALDTPGTSQTPPPDGPLPAPDCLGDVGPDGTVYCVDPATLAITATHAEGSRAWSVTLAEDELAGPIAALTVAGGTPWLVSLADTGPPCPSGDAGHCARTVKLAPIDPDANTLVHKPLAFGHAGFVRTLGSTDRVYQLDGTDLLALGIGEDIYLAVDVHELVADADPALLDSWRFLGASIVRVAAKLGYSRPNPALAERLYPGRYVRTLARTPGGALHVELDAGTERLDPTTLVPVTPASGRPLFAGQPYEAIGPRLLAPLRDEAIEHQVTRALALGERARSTASATTVLESDVPDPPPRPGEYEDSSERTVHDCADGGTLELERHRLFITWPTEELDEVYRYADCGVTVAADDADLPGGRYRLDGVFVREREVRYGSNYFAATRHEWRAFELDTPDGLTRRTDGETTGNDTSNHGGTLYARTTTLARYEERRDGTLLLGIRGAEVDELSQNRFGEPLERFGGHWSVSGTVVGGQSVAVRIDPAFERPFVFPDVPGAPPTARFTGHLRATADDGSTLEVDAVTDPVIDQWLADYTVSNAVASLSERKLYDALRIPVSVYTGAAD